MFLWYNVCGEKMKKKLLIFIIGILSLSSFTVTKAIEPSQRVLSLNSQHAMVWNVDDGQTVYEKNAHEKMYPASLTKIMTSLVALEHINSLRTEIVLGPEVFESLNKQEVAMAGYKEGDHARLLDLMYGMMMTSGADATRAIAMHVAGSEAAFVELMNQKAQELELENTHFTNVSGLHDENHYTTAADMVVVLREALKQEAFYKLFTANRYTSVDHSRQFHASRQGECQMLGIDGKFLIGSKNGYTLEGGLCLAALIKTADTSYLVITGNAGKDAASGKHLIDLQTIYNYLESYFEYQTVFQKQDAIADVNVRYGNEPTVAIAPHSDVKILVEKGTKAQVHLELPQDAMAAVRQGQAIAQLEVSSPSLNLRKSYTLYAMAEIHRDWLPYLCHQWWMIALIIAGVIVIVIYFINQRRATLMVRDIQQRVNHVRGDFDGKNQF